MILICALGEILKFYVIKKQSCIVAYIADMSVAVVNWHGMAVQYLFLAFICTIYFLWCICLVADNSKDVVFALKSTIFLVQE